LTATMTSMPRIQTQCKAIDTLTDGGLATGTITQVFGEKALGKSIISFQTACAAVASGRSAIILDTEQSYASYLIPYWQERMSKRFGKEIPVNEVKLERTPKVAGKKKGVTRGQVISALSNTLSTTQTPTSAH
jgi:predicted ATP-dependent serine protease